MKTLTLFGLVIGMLFSATTFAQNVPNGDFEEWENSLFGFEMPVDWWSLGSLMGGQDVTKVTPGQSGNYAAQISPVDIAGLGVTPPVLMSMPFGVTQKYGQLSGYVEGLSVNADTLFILVMMQAGADIIGIGGNFITGLVDPFTKFDVDILYEAGTADPDSCMISFVLGKSDDTANLGSAYSIDNLSLGGSAGIDEVESDFSTIGNPYPNPADNYLNIPFELKEPSEVTLRVFDMQGRQLYTEVDKSYTQGSNEMSIRVDNFGAGTYFYTISAGINSTATRTFVVR